MIVCAAWVGKGTFNQKYKVNQFSKGHQFATHLGLTSTAKLIKKKCSVYEYRVQLQATSLCQTNKQVLSSAHSMTSLLTSLLCYFIRLEQNLHTKWQVHNCSFDLEPALIFCHILRHHASCATVTEPISKTGKLVSWLHCLYNSNVGGLNRSRLKGEIKGNTVLAFTLCL